VVVRGSKSRFWPILDTPFLSFFQVQNDPILGPFWPYFRTEILGIWPKMGVSEWVPKMIKKWSCPVRRISPNTGFSRFGGQNDPKTSKMPFLAILGIPLLWTLSAPFPKNDQFWEIVKTWKVTQKWHVFDTFCRYPFFSPFWAVSIKNRLVRVSAYIGGKRGVNDQNNDTQDDRSGQWRKVSKKGVPKMSVFEQVTSKWPILALFRDFAPF
jgi:hypothetical protein